MKLTTLCYLLQEDKVLMLHRVKKEQDQNHGKWIGVGGHIEEGESPQDCVRREVYEETGLTLENPELRSVVTFAFQEKEGDAFSTEYMFVFTCTQFSGEMVKDCPEGELAWVKLADLSGLPMWEGDPHFMEPILAGEPFFTMKLHYVGEELVSWERD